MNAEQTQGNGANAPVMPTQVEKAINIRQNEDGSPISQDQMTRIHDSYAGATQALRDNNGTQADMNARSLQDIYDRNNHTPWWKRALQVLGVASIFGVGFMTHKALSKPETTDTNSVPTE